MADDAPPPLLPPLRLITIPAGTLLGFKACPGIDASRLLSHAKEQPHVALWSGIYVQLSLSQAVSYVPNQYERGEDTCCVCRLTTRRQLSAVCDDIRMADVGVSSSDKATRVLDAVRRTPSLMHWEEEEEAEVQEEKKEEEESSSTAVHPVLGVFGAHDHALCLLDCENYELALPHSLFTSEWFELEALFVFPISIKIPGGVVGGIQFLPSNPNEEEDGSQITALRAAFERMPTLSKWDMADAAMLGPTLEAQFEKEKLLEAVRSSWLVPNL